MRFTSGAMHSHAHDHHAHDHAHGHHHHGSGDRRYSIAIAINLGFVAVEAAAGFLANSTALLSDAAHNLSDVLGLALAGGAAWLAANARSSQHTYGFSKATILAALANALVLVGASGAILWEALKRLFTPEAVDPFLVMGVATAGVIVNGATALLFVRGRHEDVNVRGAFLHMAADAAVSAAVILGGLAIFLTGQYWIDPLLSVGVVALIVWGTWGLLRESSSLALDAAPAHIDVAEVRTFLAEQPGVTAVHDLHVWAMSAREPAMTAHVVRPEGSDDAFLASVTDGIAKRFKITHVTLQVERTRRDECGQHS